MNFSKVISTRVNEAKEFLVKVLKSGKDDSRERKLASLPGFESVPKKDLIAIYAETSVRGKSIIIGYINKSHLSGLLEGESRVYSLQENGEASIDIILRKDQTMEIGGNSDFMVRFSGLEQAYNELKNDFNDFVTEYNSHVHGGVTAGGALTAVTTSTASPSNGDITPAKIDQIKTI